MEKVVWSGLYVCRKQSRGHAGSRESWSVRNAGVTPGRSLTNTAPMACLSTPSSAMQAKTGARCLSDQRLPGHTYVYGGGTEERA
jgi:hypothetical protein